MSRYSRAEVISWLEREGCEMDTVIPNGIIFFDPSGTQFVLPDPTDDGWLDADLIDDVIANRWVGVGVGRPRRY